MPFKRREGAEAPSRLAGPLYWCFPRWIPTGACSSMWVFVWEKSKQKCFFPPPLEPNPVLKSLTTQMGPVPGIVL